MADIPVFLFRIVKDGRVLAEAPLTIKEEDNQEAWDLFRDGFGNLSMMTIGALFQTVAIACGQSSVPAGTKEIVGLQIVAETPGRPHLAIANGHMPEMKGLHI